jgi:hypothetical protein
VSSADLAAGSVLIALPLVLFWPTLSGKLVVAGYDLILYSYPYRVAAATAIRHGQFPFWNPDLFGGVPFLANIQAAVLYPFNLLFVWPGGPQLLSWSIIVHLALAGLFFYAFARKALALRTAAAVLAAIAFSASGYAIAQSEHLNQADALPWVPALVLAFDRAYVTRRPIWSATLGLILALQIFAGHPQDVYFGVLLVVVWAIVLLWRRRGAGARMMLRPLLSPLLGLFAGLLTAAVQLIPTLELTRFSYRSGGLPWAEATAFSLPGHGVLGNLLPDYVSPLYTEYAGYIGLLATVLALFALVRLWRQATVAVLGTTAVLAVLFALGHATPVFWLAYHLLPGVSSFRVPARALLVSTFAGSALAGVGADEVDRLLRARQWRLAALPVAFAGGLLLLEAAAYGLQRLRPQLALLKIVQTPIPAQQLLIWSAIVALMGLGLLLARRHTQLMSLLLVAIAFAEMVLAAQPLNPLHALPGTLYQPSAALDTLLPSDRSPYRTLSLAGLTDQQLNDSLPDPRFHAYTTRRSLDQPDFPLQDGHATLDGYDGGLLPLASYLQFRRLLLPPATPNVPDYPLIVLTDRPWRPDLLGLLGVRDVLVQAGSSSIDPSLFTVIGEAGTVVVLENRAVQPRAFLVHHVVTSRGSSPDFSTLQQPDFDPATSAIASAACPSSPSTGGDGVTLLSNDLQSLQVRTSSDSPSLLVVSSIAYPGWSARLDGRSAPLLTVDDLVQGVCLPAGQHRIELRFTPTAWPLAMAASGLGLLLVLYLGLADYFQRPLPFQLPDERRQRREHLPSETRAGKPL